MTSQIEKFIHQLYDNRLMRSDKEYLLFEDAIVNLSDSVVVEDIPRLCRAFDDNTQEEEVMFGLIRLIEQFEGEKSVRLTIEGILEILGHAGYWAEILTMRILNSESERGFYKKALQELDEISKEKIVNLIIRINNESPEIFREKVDEVLHNI